jgi:hypothetical protein
MSVVRFAIVTGLILFCSAGACAETRMLPRFITAGANSSGELAVFQAVEFAESGINVCRTLRNVSKGRVVISWIYPAATNPSQFLTFVLDEQNESMRDNPTIHPHYVPPPPPRAPGATEGPEPYQVLAPNAQVTSCQHLSIPASQQWFRVVSVYEPDLLAGVVPASVAAGARIATHDYGAVVSNLCRVSVARRRIRCDR